MGTMCLSVIIPVYNAEKYLPELFACLDKCQWNEGDEVLLIDNGSTDQSSIMCVNRALEDPTLYRYFRYTEKADSYASRNYGVSQARNEVLVFTDSDCKPDSHWIDAIHANLEPGVVLGGSIKIEIVRNTIWEHFDSIAHLQTENMVHTKSVATANMAALRADFDRVGKFTERFSGGDYDWSRRASEKGVKIKYVPEMSVVHPSRKTYGEIEKKEQRIAYGQGLAAYKGDCPYIKLLLTYTLKIFKLDTNMRYTRQLRKRGFTFSELAYFNLKFMKIRLQQFKFSKLGYRQVSARKLKLK
ncbi:glycosyltransferase [Pseudoflavonifractor sp. An85]|uniref:glycosyltransferase family 2 protein n=1 Tax=Pseudoflavonifractor sp. An85 TaxID=1965661 RepID=UPI000B3AA87C|nr:glycosyltransferase [Pseudoflavonifractor sp. An85]OUN22678.1 hypothetical protein B5G37_09725 [Pseudoflavonifractor sp. An85]